MTYVQSKLLFDVASGHDDTFDGVAPSSLFVASCFSFNELEGSVASCVSCTGRCCAKENLLDLGSKCGRCSLLRISWDIA